MGTPESRPPDEVVYDAWEPDPASEYEEVFHVPVEGSLLGGFTYKEVRVPRYRRERRIRYEKWRSPQMFIPRALPSDDPSEVTFVAVEIPAYRMARWEYEYRSAK